MIELLKEVARGKRGSRDLTYNEAVYAAESILHDSATPVQIGAFLAAERMKLESTEELAGFVDVCRKYSHREPVQQGIDFAGPYDGRKSSFIATFPSAFLLAAAGLPVTLHSSASLPPKWGVTVQDLIHSSGIPVQALTRSAAIAAAEQSGVLFANPAQWCPPLEKLRAMREELGMRTIFNTAEKLVDYSHSPYLVYGIYHNTVFDRISRLIIQLGYQRALVVQGVEGSEDLYIDRPTRVYTIRRDVAELDVIDPEAFGLDTVIPEMNWDAPQQLQTAEAVMQGQGHMAFYNQTLLNSAVRLHLAGRVDSVEEGVYTCKELLDQGEAWKVYCSWKKALLYKETMNT